MKLTTGRIYFRLEGEPGLPVLALLHPIGADHSLWDQVVPLLLPTHQVLRPDLRGHGGSDTEPGDRSLDQFVGDVIDLCGALGISSLHLCGISLGGFVAASVAKRRPELVRSLTLCSTAVKLLPPPGGWDGRAAAVRAQGMAFLADGMVQRMVSPGHRQEAAVGTLRTVFVRTDPEGYAGACAVLGEADLSQIAPGVAAATLIVTGEQDALVPADAGKALLSHLAQAEHVSLPCGHFPPIEVPAAFARELLRWTGQRTGVGDC
ncbi:alpha/beta fold hydrolase [Ramlibacter sp. Leaf400]|uniref:alpha/beta fold hydrolase n=1 Tax=Ramlibacter sp. Leaf400 TaxID=1736365 RepID=UPI0006FAF25E|nr:alpha/beta fold hydrolase [Ramlibacter sp. Leaf400]